MGNRVFSILFIFICSYFLSSNTAYAVRIKNHQKKATPVYIPIDDSYLDYNLSGSLNSNQNKTKSLYKPFKGKLSKTAYNSNRRSGDSASRVFGMFGGMIDTNNKDYQIFQSEYKKDPKAANEKLFKGIYNSSVKTVTNAVSSLSSANTHSNKKLGSNAENLNRNLNSLTNISFGSSNRNTGTNPIKNITKMFDIDSAW